MNIHDHGEALFTWKGNVLYVEVLGPFNEEGVIKTTNEYLNKLINKPVEYFSVIELWNEDALSSPDGLNKVKTLWQQVENKGCISLALVVSNNVQHEIAKTLMPNIAKVFHKREEAEQWVSLKNAPFKTV